MTETEALNCARNALERIADSDSADHLQWKIAKESLDATAKIAPPVAAGSVDRPKLHDMTLPDTETRDWYFDCDGHYIDVELRKDGHYSIYFRNRADGGKGWLDTGALIERAEKAEADVSLLRQERDNLQKLSTSRRDWAEKAEAELKARDFFVDVLNCQVKKTQDEADVLFHRLNAANGHLAMARERIEELETEIKVLHRG